MKYFWLTDDELLALRAAHRSERNRRAAYKINTVILLGTGWKLNAVKETLLLDEETLRSLTSQEVIQYVRDTFSVDYSLSGMRDYCIV